MEIKVEKPDERTVVITMTAYSEDARKLLGTLVEIKGVIKSDNWRWAKFKCRRDSMYFEALDSDTPGVFAGWDAFPKSGPRWGPWWNIFRMKGRDHYLRGSNQD